jgi:predicted nucleic acid-binding protein
VSLPCLDTNVLLRAILQDHPDHSPGATALLERMASGEAAAYASTAVFFEVAFVLLRRPGADPPKVHGALATMLGIDGLRFDERETLAQTVAFARQFDVPLVDAYRAASMAARGSSTIISFHRRFDRFPALERVEP